MQSHSHTKIVGWAIYLHAHVKYLKKLLKEDKLQISGPGVGTPVRSAQLVFKVTDRDELDKLVAGDPYSIHGLVASSTVNLWEVESGSMEDPYVKELGASYQVIQWDPKFGEFK